MYSTRRILPRLFLAQVEQKKRIDGGRGGGAAVWRRKGEEEDELEEGEMMKKAHSLSLSSSIYISLHAIFEKLQNGPPPLTPSLTLE